MLTVGTPKPIAIDGNTITNMSRVLYNILLSYLSYIFDISSGESAS